MIAAEQLHGAEAVAFGTEDAALLDLAELADGAVAGLRIAPGVLSSGRAPSFRARVKKALKCS